MIVTFGISLSTRLSIVDVLFFGLLKYLCVDGVFWCT
jgi:hypothetical protein